MSVEDFLTYFTTSNICKYEDQIEETHLVEKNPSQSGADYFMFELTEPLAEIDILVS